MKTIINSAKKTLENGNLVIFPTETVYGLGGDATNVGAIKKIYGLNERIVDNSFINFTILEKNNEVFFKYIPKKKIKLQNKENFKENPFGVLKNLNLN